MYKWIALYNRRHPRELVYVAPGRATSLWGLFVGYGKEDSGFYRSAKSQDRVLCNEFDRLERHRHPACDRSLHSAICSVDIRPLATRGLDMTLDHVVLQVRCFHVSRRCGGIPRNSPATGASRPQTECRTVPQRWPWTSGEANVCRATSSGHWTLHLLTSPQGMLTNATFGAPGHPLRVRVPRYAKEQRGVLDANFCARARRALCGTGDFSTNKKEPQNTRWFTHRVREYLGTAFASNA